MRVGMRCPALCRWSCAALLAIACGLASGSAEAHGGEAIVLVPLLGDMIFTVYDFVAFADEDRSNGWLIPQFIWTTPQAVLLNIEPFSSGELPLFLSVWTSQLSAFSIYGLASPDVSTSALYGISWAIGFNTALTTKVTALAVEREWSPRAIAITQLVAATPQLIVAGYALASPESIPRQRAAVLAFGGWSGALFAHGVASLILFRPKPPPKAKQAWQLAPSMLHGEHGLAPGLVAFGTL